MRRHFLVAGIIFAFGTTAFAQANADATISLGTTSAAVPVTAKYFDADAAGVFGVLEKMYKNARIKVTERDSVNFKLGNSALAAKQKVGNLKLDKAFNCGGGGEGKSAVAAMADLMLSVRSEVKQVGSDVQVATYVVANGQLGPAGGSSPVSCTSLGVLEKKLNPTPMQLAQLMTPGVVRARITTQGKRD